MMNSDQGTTSEKGSLVVLKKGIYTSGNVGGKRIRICEKTPGLVTDRFGEQVLVSIDEGCTVLVHINACEEV